MRLFAARVGMKWTPPSLRLQLEWQRVTATGASAMVVPQCPSLLQNGGGEAARRSRAVTGENATRAVRAVRGRGAAASCPTPSYSEMHDPIYAIALRAIQLAITLLLLAATLEH